MAKIFSCTLVTPAPSSVILRHAASAINYSRLLSKKSSFFDATQGCYQGLQILKAFLSIWPPVYT